MDRRDKRHPGFVFRESWDTKSGIFRLEHFYNPYNYYTSTTPHTFSIITSCACMHYSTVVSAFGLHTYTFVRNTTTLVPTLKNNPIIVPPYPRPRLCPYFVYALCVEAHGAVEWALDAVDLRG